jgi:hypothetical protein
VEDLTSQSRSGYDLEPGDRFRYGGIVYRALARPTGEFNAYVKVFSELTRERSEIIILHGARLLLLVTE